MVDSSTDDMWSDSGSTTSYMLTSMRLLLRLLDLGVVLPELVLAQDGKIQFFDERCLHGVNLAGGASIPPILIELKADVMPSPSALPQLHIEHLHFATEDDKANCLERQFENVPLDLFSLRASPELFTATDETLPVPILPKLDKLLLKEKYRQLDTEAGLLAWLINEASDISAALCIIEVYSRSNDAANRCSALVDGIMANTEDPMATAVLNAYVPLLAEYDYDAGWVAGEVLGKLHAAIPRELTEGDDFRRWYGYCSDVIGGKHNLGHLSDKKHVVLRGLLLHLLNPDAESIERMARRDPSPGRRVVHVAKALAAGREGFAAMPASLKQQSPGLYFLLGPLLANVINGESLALEGLAQSTEGDMVKLLWHGQKVGAYQLEQPQDQGAEDAVEAVGQTLELDEVASTLRSVKQVASVAAEDDHLQIVLAKALSKAVPKLGAIRAYCASQPPLDLTVESQLLDFNIKSHKAKLSRDKLLAVLEMQTKERKSGLRFDLEEPGFYARVTLDARAATEADHLANALELLIDANRLMKQTKAK